jgi:tRNA(adenine34) deaminase
VAFFKASSPTGADDTNRGDVDGAAFEQKVDSGNEGAAGGQHRVKHEALAVGKVIGQPFGVRGGLQGLVVSHHAEKADLRCGHEFHHTFEHPQPRAQNGHHKGSWLADGEAGGIRYRRANGHLIDPHIARRFVREKSDELLRERAKNGGRRRRVAKHGELVSDERMICYVDSHRLNLLDRGGGDGLNFDTHMADALDEARACLATDDVPVGAIVIDADGTVIGRGRNERELTKDPTAHAEVLAIREAAEKLGTWQLTGVTLVVTLEPCAMCAGAILAARIPTVVFGAWDDKAGAAGSVHDLLRDRRLPHRVEVHAGIREAESAELLSAFFARRRATH